MGDGSNRAHRTAEQPLVSIVTPVYNGESYLRECVESVLNQNYQNWEYVIVNNCSTDRTLEIAQEYAARDPRIRIYSNGRFASIIENHNIALRQISTESKYCKVVFADDWLFPECLSEMVTVAEMYHSVGIVAAYGLDGKEILWEGLPYPCPFISGRELCRKTLLGGPYVFGTPTSLLVRSELIRSKSAFYNEKNLHADNEACYEILQDADFGFVHKILTFSRPRRESNTAAARDLESYVLGNLSAVISHGPAFLTVQECAVRREQWLKQYYGVLAKSFLRLREKKFWEFHRTRLMQLGFPLNRVRLFRAVMREVLQSLARPMDVLDGILNWWPRAFSRVRIKPTR